MALIDRIIAAFTKTHSALPDKPSMPAADLKAWYDQSANELKTQTNGMIADLTATTEDASGADQIGAGPVAVGDVSTGTVMGKLKYVLAQVQAVVVGQIPDGTITEPKLSSSVVSDIGSKALFKNSSGTFTSGGTTYQVTDAFITANTQVIISPTQEKTGSWTVASAAGSFTVTSDAVETSNVTFDWGATK